MEKKANNRLMFADAFNDLLVTSEVEAEIWLGLVSLPRIHRGFIVKNDNQNAGL
jgi:hypothetical protein